MQISDNCAICRTSMTKKPLRRMMPCHHYFHEECFRPLQIRDSIQCPMCRTVVSDTEVVEHSQYNKHNNQDRSRVIECFERGGDWKSMASSLNIKYSTAYKWIRSGERNQMQRGGYKPKMLSDENIAFLISKLEDDCEMTLKQLKNELFQQFNITCCVSTIANYLNGQLFTFKKVRLIPYL